MVLAYVFNRCYEVFPVLSDLFVTYFVGRLEKIDIFAKQQGLLVINKAVFLSRISSLYYLY